ncbi:hypothetical protein JCM33374_g4818 [Metschnikowia sp. JCM 33374]|nr:hypothetical protein JCM33374_g4818 [Metschnikowia sp. JCM 33374]
MKPTLFLRRAKSKRQLETFLAFERPPPPVNRDRAPRTSEEAAKEALERRPYYDPANSTLDFSKSNRNLLHEIKNDNKNRVRLRIRGPANIWQSVHGNRGQLDDIKTEVETAITGAKFSLKSSLQPLAVGDVVLLNGNSTLLHLVVAAPNTLASNVYTFINHEGEVTFGTKHHISLRIAGVLSPERTEFMNLVAIEDIRPGVAPIGVPDSAFSRKTPEPPRRPKEPKKRQAKTPESALSPLEPASASLEAGPRDFTVAQASAQLLTDTTVKTYIVPTSARDIYSAHFAKISIDAFSKVTDFGNKLDYFHKVLQYDDANCLIQSPRTIPLFELFSIVANHDIPSKSAANGNPSGEDQYLRARALLRNFRADDSQALGKAVPESTARTFAIASYSASSYIAFISALSRSGRKWKINVQKSTKTPISVDVLPVSNAMFMDSALEYLKTGGVEEVASHVLSVVKDGAAKTPAPDQYPQVIQMLKDFVSQNITNDHTMESLSGSLVRSIDAKLRAAGLAASSRMQFSHEFARSRAYEILMLLETTGDRNPLRWDSALGLPGTNTSRDSDKYLQFYKYLDSQFQTYEDFLAALPGGNTSSSRLTPSASPSALSKYLADDFYAKDPMASFREDFGDTPVYCIDSETAHEIDDGISIEDLGRKWAITVHIANPTSYLKPTSSLSQIALEKGSTIYLPEGPTMMLPDIVSKLCGLNGGHKTRTLGIRFLINKRHLDLYHRTLQANPSAKPSDELAQIIGNAIEQTATVKFYTVSNFPKNFTYKKVNEILKDPENLQKFHSNTLKKGSHEFNLFNLHMMADLIKHFRVAVRSGFEVNSDSSKVTVNYSQEEVSDERAFVEVENGWQIALPKGNKSDTPVISVTREVNQNQESKSQHLVSNLMIAANFAGSVFAKREGFPIIYRHSQLDVKKAVWDEIRRLNHLTYFKKTNPNPEQRSQLLSVMTSANFSAFQIEHSLLGLDLYSNLTSPLRRYVDMVNHWKFQEYIHKQDRQKRQFKQPDSGEVQLVRDRIPEKPEPALHEILREKRAISFSRAKTRLQRLELKKQESKKSKSKPSPASKDEPAQPLRHEFGMRTSDMDYVAAHLQGCDLRNRKAQKFSDTFWMAKFLRRYFDLKFSGHIATPIPFSFLLGSDAKHGDVRAELIGFNSLRTTVIQNPYVMQKFATEQWTVGQVLKAPRFRVLKLDFIEGEFTVEIVGPDDVSEDIV